LSDAILTGANLTDATLTGANLTDATLTGADLTDAILTGANLTDAILTGADLTGAILTGANLTNVILPQLPQLPHLPHQGVAYEIHNLFNMLDLARIREFLHTYNIEHPVVNPNTQDPQIPYVGVFDPLLIFIAKSALFLADEKVRYLENLINQILPRVYEYANQALFKLVIDFVCKQNDDFIEQYIRIYVVDCLNAYDGVGNNNSCTKGMIERVITSLNTVASAILLDTPDNPLCLSITSLFPTISFTDTVREWCVNYLEDGPNNAELVH
jgi:hypothetical protein